MLISYLLEGLLERWQSRRKTLEISANSDRQRQQERKREVRQTQSSNQLASGLYLAYKPIRVEPTIHSGQLASYPSILLYVSMSLVSLLCLQAPPISLQNPVSLARPIQEPSQAQLASLGWIQRLRTPITTNRERWIHLPTRTGPNNNSNNRLVNQQHRWRQTSDYLRKTLNRISNRIGARNTIRVHNAFRDLAWQLLASFSMPTPIVYELRRQHFYSPEEDMLNDMLHDKNTTRTLRVSRSFLKPARQALDRDDDDEPDTFRDRLKVRLEDLVNLSRRSLFGRVVRLPALFPFKRQHEDDESKGQQPVGIGVRRRLRRRSRRDPDRQMISINGKQYYVNDEGELKALEEQTKP